MVTAWRVAGLRNIAEKSTSTRGVSLSILLKMVFDLVLGDTTTTFIHCNKRYHTHNAMKKRLRSCAGGSDTIKPNTRCHQMPLVDPNKLSYDVAHPRPLRAGCPHNKTNSDVPASRVDSIVTTKQ